MLSHLEPLDAAAPSIATLPVSAAAARCWPPTRGHGFAPSAISAAIAGVARSVRAGNPASHTLTGGRSAPSRFSSPDEQLHRFTTWPQPFPDILPDRITDPTPHPLPEPQPAPLPAHNTSTTQTPYESA